MEARVLSGFGICHLRDRARLELISDAEADYDEMFWPQVVRGAAVMSASSRRPGSRYALPAASRRRSGLFNLMRNLGGAIGLALIDTILYGRIAMYAEDFRVRLLAGDITAAKAIGLDPALIATGRRTARCRRDSVRAADGGRAVAGNLRQRGLGNAGLCGDCRAVAGAVRARPGDCRRR